MSDFEHLADHRHPRAAADQQQVRQVAPGQARMRRASLRSLRFARATESAREISSNACRVIVISAACAVALDVDAGLLAGGERLLGFLGAFTQASNAHHVVARIFAKFLDEFAGQVLGQQQVPLAAAQLCVAADRHACGFDRA